MEPTQKSSELEALLTSILGGVSRMDTVRSGGCVFCKTPNLKFKDELSKREYRISGMCQDCQDSVFREEEEV